MSVPEFANHRDHVDAVITSALKAANPRKLMTDAFAANPPPPGPVHVIAIGKAAVPMSLAAGDYFKDRIRFGICTHVPGMPARPSGFPSVIGSMPADHPLPTAANVEAAEAIKFITTDFAAGSGEGNMSTLVVLLSGGGSAHLTLPAEGLHLEDLRRTAGALLRTGATVNELNIVRKHLEQLKGGRLAQLAFPGRVCCYVLSDVVGDPLDVIASGPCAPDPTSYADAIAVMEKYALAGASDQSLVMDHLRMGAAGSFPDTPEPGDAVFGNVTHHIIGNHETVVRSAKEILGRFGFAVEARTHVQGEARDVARQLVAHAVKLRRESGRACALILGGETTVSVRGTGFGGRNQELALAAAIDLATIDNAAVLAFATDGADGPTGNAGAVVTSQTIRMATMLGLEPEGMLKNNDSATLFARLDMGGAGCVIKTDPTGTNVNDLAIALMY